MSYGKFLLTSADTPGIELFPGEGFSEGLDLVQNNQRSFNGTLHSYKVAGAKQYNYSLPLTFVNSATKNYIDTNWLADTTLFYITYDPTSLSGFTTKVTISNIASPLPGVEENQSELSRGVLQLVAKDGGDRNDKAAFIVNDAVFGLLDQTYNGLG